MTWLTNRTLPSASTMFTPPGCMLRAGAGIDNVVVGGVRANAGCHGRAMTPARANFIRSKTVRRAVVMIERAFGIVHHAAIIVGFARTASLGKHHGLGGAIGDLPEGQPTVDEEHACLSVHARRIGMAWAAAKFPARPNAVVGDVIRTRIDISGTADIGLGLRVGGTKE